MNETNTYRIGISRFVVDARTPEREIIFGLIGNCQWRLVAVGAWYYREKKSGELCFE
jgi:hypothetical protein